MRSRSSFSLSTGIFSFYFEAAIYSTFTGSGFSTARASNSHFLTLLALSCPSTGFGCSTISIVTTISSALPVSYYMVSCLRTCMCKSVWNFLFNMYYVKLFVLNIIWCTSPTDQEDEWLELKLYYLCTYVIVYHSHLYTIHSTCDMWGWKWTHLYTISTCDM